MTTRKGDARAHGSSAEYLSSEKKPNIRRGKEEVVDEISENSAECPILQNCATRKNLSLLIDN